MQVGCFREWRVCPCTRVAQRIYGYVPCSIVPRFSAGWFSHIWGWIKLFILLWRLDIYTRHQKWSAQTANKKYYLWQYVKRSPIWEQDLATLLCRSLHTERVRIICTQCLFFEHAVSHCKLPHQRNFNERNCRYFFEMWSFFFQSFASDKHTSGWSKYPLLLRF